METPPGHFSRDELRALCQARAGPCVSCYIPVPPPGTKWQTGQLELSQLIAAAEARLEAHGWHKRDYWPVLTQLEKLGRPEAVWRGSGLGLAAFAAPGFCATYRLPYPVPVRQQVGDCFAIRPLLPLAESAEFLVLAVTLTGARLLRSTAAEEMQLGLEDAPPPVEQFRMAAGEAATGWHPAPGTGGAGGAMAEPIPAEEKYALALAAAANRTLAPERAPLVLAGEPALIGELRKHLTYAHTLPEYLPGNPSIRSNVDLRAAAWPLARPGLAQEQHSAWDEIRRRRGTDGHGTADDLGEILAAAYAARIAALFLPAEGERWGRYDPAKDHFLEGTPDGPEAVELLNLAGVQTLRTNGRVFVLPQVVMGEPQLAALLRY